MYHVAIKKRSLRVRAKKMTATIFQLEASNVTDAPFEQQIQKGQDGCHRLRKIGDRFGTG